MFSALTFNMQNGQAWDEENPDKAEVSLSRVIAFLREQDTDIMFLQEVERGYDGGKQIEPPPHYARLKRDLGAYDSVFAYPRPNRMEIPFGLGLAIFSKTPVRNFFRKDLPPAEIAFEFGGVLRKPSHRLLIGADAEIEGREVRLINTHLQAFFMINASSNDHHIQRDRVEIELRRCRGPTLLGGDFNCAPGETLIEQFKRAGFYPSQNREVTWRRMPFVIDHIFYNRSLRLEACSVIPTEASDHHAVRSEFSFRE
jgi:endonuclease/exonuclease/phosphatase family metal-dependent hydrolase